MSKYCFRANFHETFQWPSKMAFSKKPDRMNLIYIMNRTQTDVVELITQQ